MSKRSSKSENQLATKNISSPNQHIAIVANSTWNLYNFRQNVIEKFLAQGWRVTLLAPVDDYTHRLTEQHDVEFVELRELTRDSTSLMSNYSLYKELKRLYGDLRPNVILHYTSKPNIFGSLAAGKLGIRNISVITGLGYAFIRKGILQSIIRQLYRRAAKSTTQFVFENEDDLALFKSGIIKSDQGVSVKGCGVDIDHYQTAVPLSDDQSTVFTFIGRLLTDKGIMEYLKAAKMGKHELGPAVTFNVIGEVDTSNPASITRQDLQQWIDDGSINYKGFIEDIRPEIEASDCIVLPSYREGMPRTMLEALAMSRPVITTHVPGCREIVDHSVNGYLVESKSSGDLLDAIKTFVKLPYGRRVEMGKAGRLRAETLFNHQLIAEQLYEIVTETPIQN